MRGIHPEYVASTIERLAHIIPDAWQRQCKRREFAEFAQLEPAEANRVAHDLGLNLKDMVEISGRGGQWRDLLARRMQRLGLDFKSVSRTMPSVARDLSISCARCYNKARCARDLRIRPRSDDTWKKFCINQPTLDALTEELR